LLRLQRLYIWRLLEGSNQSVMLYADTFELGRVAKAVKFETPKTQKMCDKAAFQTPSPCARCGAL
jgi:hypothetical protein